MRDVSAERSGWRERRRRSHFSREPRRVVRQRLVGSRIARTHRSASDAARTRRTRRARAGELGCGARSRGAAIRGRTATVRARCRRRLRRRLVDQRESVFAGQVRARGARHRQRRLQRALLHGIGRGGGLASVGSRPRPAISARRHSARENHPPRRRQRRRDDAADHAVLRGATRERRRVDRGRPPSICNGAVGGAAPAAETRKRHRIRQRSAARAGSRPSRRRGVHQRADARVRRRATCGRDVLARARRALHGRPGSDADRHRAPAGRRTRRSAPTTSAERDGSHRARTGAAGAGREQRARLHQRGARARRARPAVQRVRLAHGSGKRAGRTRARTKSRSAPGIQADRRSCRATTSRCTLARSGRDDPWSGKIRLRAARLDRRRARRTRAPRHRVQHRRVGAGCAEGRAAARRARFSGRGGFLPLGDRAAGRCRAAVGAMGRGRRHDDEPRRTRHPSPSRARSARGRAE